MVWMMCVRVIAKVSTNGETISISRPRRHCRHRYCKSGIILTWTYNMCFMDKRIKKIKENEAVHLNIGINRKEIWNKLFERRMEKNVFFRRTILSLILIAWRIYCYFFVIFELCNSWDVWVFPVFHSLVGCFFPIASICSHIFGLLKTISFYDLFSKSTQTLLHSHWYTFKSLFYFYLCSLYFFDII